MELLQPKAGEGPDKVQITFRVPRAIAREFDRLCSVAGLTLSEGLRQVMAQYVSAHGKSSGGKAKG